MNHTIEIPAGSLTFRSQLGIKVKRPTQKKPFIEQKVGDDFHRDTGTWRKRERVIDRDADRYREVITDAEGNEVRRCDEPLSQHRGRGDAKRK
jgi:hypothetical protein